MITTFTSRKNTVKSIAVAETDFSNILGHKKLKFRSEHCNFGVNLKYISPNKVTLAKSLHNQHTLDELASLIALKYVGYAKTKIACCPQALQVCSG